MNKATSALRRSSIRLKSFTSGHSDLHMVISDLKEVKGTAKMFMLAQQTAWRDIAKWAGKERNSSISSSLAHFVQLSDLWADVQVEFLEQVNKFKYQFDMILEGEQRIDRIRENLAACELRETKLKKDLKKATQKGTVDDIREIEDKIIEASNSIKAARKEITERVHENEASKAVRLKEGFTRFSDSYIDLARKSLVIFQAQKDISSGLPHVNYVEGEGIHEIQYHGAEEAKQIVFKAFETVKALKRQPQSPYRPAAPVAPSGSPSMSSQTPPAPMPSPPPPYSAVSSPSHVYRNVRHSWQNESFSRSGVATGVDSRFSAEYPQPAAVTTIVHYDLPPGEYYELDVAGSGYETTI